MATVQRVAIRLVGRVRYELDGHVVISGWHFDTTGFEPDEHQRGCARCLAGEGCVGGWSIDELASASSDLELLDMLA